PDMVHLPALAGGPVDVALVPVGGWGPRLSGGHLGPAQAARVCAEVGVGVASPVHWGTLHAPGGRHLPRGWMDHAATAFEAAAQGEGPGTRGVLRGPGGAWASCDDVVAVGSDTPGSGFRDRTRVRLELCTGPAAAGPGRRSGTTIHRLEGRRSRVSVAAR